MNRICYLILFGAIIFLLQAPIMTYAYTYDKKLETLNYIEVKEDIDLKGKSIKFEKGAVIEFKGGVIKNGTIVCDNNIIEGYHGLSNNTRIEGTILGPFNLGVFCLDMDDPKFDIGPIVNMVGKVCTNMILPEGKYYYKTPIQLTGIKLYTQYSNLVYNGQHERVVSLSFIGCSNAFINIYGSISCDRKLSKVNYTKVKKTSIIGVGFENLNNSTIVIGEVSYFNTNICVIGRGGGNCYNKYSINISAFSNEHLRITQETSSDGKIGWCNENTFIGGRFCNWSSFDWKNCESVAINIEGQEGSDEYNKVNSLLFIKPSMEGFKEYAIKAKNAKGCNWQDVRTEGCGHFGLFSGSCSNNNYTVDFGTTDVVYDDCTTFPFKKEGLFPIYTNKKILPGKKSVISLDTSTAKYFRVEFLGDKSKGRVSVRYLKDAQGKDVKSESLPAPRSFSPSTYYLNKSTKLWTLGVDSDMSEFDVPSNVSRVELAIWGDVDGYVIYSDTQTDIFD